MQTSSPHYLLYSEAHQTTGSGRWRFVLRSADGVDRLEADEVEPEMRGERLELLAVVRGLEALDQPSRVTLVTASTYVREGIRHGVYEWRKNGWCWEFFGQMVPVKHQDLWKRVDRALAFHHVECRNVRVDLPHVGRPGATIPKPHMTPENPPVTLSQQPRPAPTPAKRQMGTWPVAWWKWAKQRWTGIWTTQEAGLRLG